MPVTRRQILDHDRRVSIDDTSEELPSLHSQPPDVNDFDIEAREEVDEDGEQEDESEAVFPPPGLKEISSLASWVVSTAKPGSGVVALRSPDMTQLWQSDGPQPHTLSIHFFKLVPIVLIRIFLDFENDESYTPTKIQLLAGMAAHDLQEFAEMEFEHPTGWIDVDFSNVGPIPEEGDDTDENGDLDWSVRPILRAMLLQIRILENHQNGKDTHLRGVQIFARDETQSDRKNTVARSSRIVPLHEPYSHRPQHTNNIKLAPWMQEPDLR